MRIDELFTEIVVESLRGVSVEDIGLSDMIVQADEGLDDPASTAIDMFTGMAPRAKSLGVWGGIMQAGRLEDAYSPDPSPRGLLVRQQLEAAFEPIRRELRQRFGNSLVLYRAQGAVDDGKGTRNTLSWTSDFHVAAEFAGVDSRLLRVKPIPDSEVREALERYQRQGRLAWRGKIYVRTDQPTNDPSLDEYYYDILDRDGDHLTDGDNIEQELRSVQQGVDDLIERRQEKLSRIVSAEIPVDDIIWITDRAGQSEFILHNAPGRIGYLGKDGKMPTRAR